jgi:ribosomal protein L35AE/L33A
MPSPLPPPRRIATGNLPLPYKLTSVKTPEPAVEVLCENVVQKAESDGNVYRGTVFTHEKIPTNNDGV